MRSIGVADETHATGGEIRKPADIIVDGSVRAERQRVDGEVPPPRIRGEVASERHLGAAPVGLDVLAQRRRFDRASFDDHRHRAVRDAGERDLEPGRMRAANHFVRRGGGRQVEIKDGRAEREIADRAADQPGLLARSAERFERSRERALLERRKVPELSALQTREDGHSIRPGTRTPFSTCAGT